MKRVVLLTAAAIFVLQAIPTVTAQSYKIRFELVQWLEAKPYEGAKRRYTEADLTVPDAVMNALGRLGVSHLTVIRNEMYARHGYIFKTPVLSAIFKTATWYKPDPAIGLNALTAIEAKNVNWIKTIEDEYDYKVISSYLSKRAYTADSRLATNYTSENTGVLDIPLSVQLALNHLFVNPARLLRNESFARHGLAFTDAVLKKIFSAVTWYSPKNATEESIGGELIDRERVNLALLREQEWIDIIDSVKFSLPTGVTSIPVIGYNALFIKNVDYGDDVYHFSWPDAWTAMEEEGVGLDAHVTDTEALVDGQTIEAIRVENSPRQKLILFFSKKRYVDYVDKILLNRSDMKVPSFLREAVVALGIDWFLLLRKEIHARNGAKFIDPRVGPIFAACPWYKAKHNLNPRTLSRFPAGVSIKSQELRNYSLLEGEELWQRMQEMKRLTKARIACDLLGNFYFVKIDTVRIAGDEALTLGHGFKTLLEYQAGNLQEIIDSLIRSYQFDLDRYRDEEAAYYPVGC